MELDLKNFSSTLAVGVFVVGVAFLGLHLFWKSYQAPLFAAISKWGTMGQALTGLFLVLIVFGCGIVGETFSNRFVDADYGEWLYERILPTEKKMRANTLFGQEEDVPRVAIELAKTGRLSRFARGEEDKAFAELVERHLIDHPHCTRTSLESALNSNAGTAENTKKLQGLASSLYYTAKNVLTEHDNVAQELWTIQRRLDFCRSIATYSAWFAILGFAALILHLILRFWFPKRKFAIPWAPKLLFCFGLSFLFIITRYCYASEEREFNIRTYGYFATLSEADLPTFSASSAPTAPGDFSGAVKLPNGQILFVHDAKAGTTLTRAGTVDPLQGAVAKVEVHWPQGESIASDLEAVCLLPGTSDILLCESGYYHDPKKHPEPQYGRIFRCEPQFAVGNSGKLLSLKVTGVWHWPKALPGGALTEDIEGVVCLKAGDQHILVAAERGGRIFQASVAVNSAAQQLVFANNGQPVLDLRSDPRFAFLKDYDRKISDLTITSTGELWASAAFEPDTNSDLGPFRSTTYKLGQITDPNAVVTFAPDAGKGRVDGFKVEALTEIEPGKMFIGTDDEKFGGTWRVIVPSRE